MAENTIELSLFFMRSFIFVKMLNNNTCMQFSNVRLLSSDGSGHLNELNLNNSFGIIAHPTSKSVESLLLCSELSK